MRKLKNEELNRLSPEQFRSAEKTPLVLVLDNVRSLLNVGSVFRTCDAFRIKALFLCGITGQPPDREIQKTALGATETVEWKYFPSTALALDHLKSEGVRVYALEQAERAVPLNLFSPPSGETMALVLGNEVKGVEQAIIDHCEGVIEIPQVGMKHSLNVAVSAGIVAWDLFLKMKK
ncbi:MAG: RNA methyltransferase [Bacteroidota bacterium]